MNTKKYEHHAKEIQDRSIQVGTHCGGPLSAIVYGREWIQLSRLSLNTPFCIYLLWIQSSYTNNVPPEVKMARNTLIDEGTGLGVCRDLTFFGGRSDFCDQQYSKVATARQQYEEACRSFDVIQ